MHYGFWKMYAIDLVLSVIDGEEQTSWWALVAVDTLIHYLEVGDYATYFSIIGTLVAYRMAKQAVTSEMLADLFNYKVS